MMTIVCQHGQLARVCELCEKDTEIMRLKEELAKKPKPMDEMMLKGATDTAVAIVEDLRQQLAALDKTATELQVTCDKQAKQLTASRSAFEELTIKTAGIIKKREDALTMHQAMAEIETLGEQLAACQKVVEAAKNLVKVKGRHHSEQAYIQLADAVAAMENTK